MEYTIYKITNKLNGKVYIGQTTESINRRWQRHCGYQLNDNTYLHRAMKKYGSENFEIEEIDKASNQEELDEKEKFFIDRYKNNSYNLKFTKGKCGGDTLSNNPNLDKIRNKISKSKVYGSNPHSTGIVMIDIITGKREQFASMKECQDKYGIPRHDVICRRCAGKIIKPYKNRYLFEYTG